MRYLGIKHRTKFSKTQGKATPTQVTILDENGKVLKVIKLNSEQDEMDFLQGIFPVKYRKITEEDDMELIKVSFPVHLLKITKGEIKKVPSEFAGPETGDKIAMILGGSGDYLARAFAEKGKTEDFAVYRIPPKYLAQERGSQKDNDKEEDATLLAELLMVDPSLFYEIETADVNLIRVRISYHNLQNSMKDRIAAEQRLHQAAIVRYFVENTDNDANTLEQFFKELKGLDPGYQSLLKIEKDREKELKKAVEALDFYNDILDPIKGLGPRIAGRIIAAIQDVRRFPSAAAFRKFCGVHVNLQNEDGEELPREKQFPRKRRGSNLGYNPEARQALFLIADQFNRRPDSRWGQKLREIKATLREKHPIAVEIKNSSGKTVKIYTNGHIHKMAIWKTLNKFASWLYKEWFRYEAARKNEDVTIAA